MEMYLTVSQFGELVQKVVASRSAYSKNSADAVWHAEDLAVLYSTVAEDVGLTLTFAETMGLLNNEKQ